MSKVGYFTALQNIINMLLVFLFLLKAGVSDAQTVKTEPMPVIEGDAVTLRTDLSEIKNDDTIIWLFGPKEFPISQIKRQDNLTSLFVTDNVEFRGRLQVDQKTGSLTIRNTRIRHSGQYKLSISREITTTKIFNVTVYVVVAETDGVKSMSVSVLEGDPVTLHTDFEIHPDALMLWRFGDKGVLLAKIDVETNEASINDADERFRDRLQIDKTGFLTIKNTRTTDSGLYELQIRGSESLQRFLLSVLAVPDPGLSSGAIAGIVIGVIVSILLLLGAAVALIYYRYRISKLKRQMGEEKKTEVTEGESVTLHTSLTEIQVTDLIKWYYETEDNLIAEINKGKVMTKEGVDGRFRSKVKLGESTGDLTINNIRTIHSGLYKLKISSSGKRTKYKRFIVTVTVKKLSVTAGGAIPLETRAEIQHNDLVLWTFGAENLLVVRKDSESTSISEGFRGRLRLGKRTGSLTIKNIRPTDSGHFKLQIISSEKTTFRRFNVIVTENQVGELAAVVMPLLNGDDLDGVNEQEDTWSL